MRVEAIQKLVGRPVRDIYGRYVGFAVGFSVDTTGELRSVGVDQGRGEFAEYPGERIVSDNDGFIVIPSWKVESAELGKKIETIRKRAQALKELAREGEISKELYDEMQKQFSEQVKKISESYSELSQSLVKRLEEIEHQRIGLDRFLANVKVQYRAGEIDEDTYKVASQYCQSIREMNDKEREEISEILRQMGQPFRAQQESQAQGEERTVAPVPEAKTG